MIKEFILQDDESQQEQHSASSSCEGDEEYECFSCGRGIDVLLYGCTVCDIAKRVLCLNCLLHGTHNSSHAFQRIPPRSAIHQEVEATPLGFDAEQAYRCVVANNDEDLVTQLDEMLESHTSGSCHKRRKHFPDSPKNLPARTVAIRVPKNEPRSLQTFVCAALATVRLDLWTFRGDDELSNGKDEPVAAVAVEDFIDNRTLTAKAALSIAFGETGPPKCMSFAPDIIFPSWQQGSPRTAIVSACVENHDAVCTACEKTIIGPGFKCIDCESPVQYDLECLEEGKYQGHCDNHILCRLTADSALLVPDGPKLDAVLQPEHESVSIDTTDFSTAFPVAVYGADCVPTRRQHNSIVQEWCRWEEFMGGESPRTLRPDEFRWFWGRHAITGKHDPSIELLGKELMDFYQAIYARKGKLISLLKDLLVNILGNEDVLKKSSLLNSVKRDQLTDAEEDILYREFYQILSDNAGFIPAPLTLCVDILQEWLDAKRGHDTSPVWLPRPFVSGWCKFKASVAWLLVSQSGTGKWQPRCDRTGQPSAIALKVFDLEFVPGKKLPVECVSAFDAVSLPEGIFNQMCTRKKSHETIGEAKAAGNIFVFVSHAWGMPEQPNARHPDAEQTDWDALCRFLSTLIVSVCEVVEFLRRVGCNDDEDINADVFSRPSLTVKGTTGQAIAGELLQDLFVLACSMPHLSLPEERYHYVACRVWLWIDYVSLPQRIPRLNLDRQEDSTLGHWFRESLEHLQLLQESMHTLCLNTTGKLATRAWCVAEIVNAQGIVSHTCKVEPQSSVARAFEWERHVRDCMRVMIAFTRKQDGRGGQEDIDLAVIHRLGLNITTGKRSESVVCKVLWNCAQEFMDGGGGWEHFGRNEEGWNAIGGSFDEVEEYCTALARREGIRMSYMEWKLRIMRTPGVAEPTFVLGVISPPHANLRVVFAGLQRFLKAIKSMVTSQDSLAVHFLRDSDGWFGVRPGEETNARRVLIHVMCDGVVHPLQDNGEKPAVPDYILLTPLEDGEESSCSSEHGCSAARLPE